MDLQDLAQGCQGEPSLRLGPLGLTSRKLRSADEWLLSRQLTRRPCAIDDVGLAWHNARASVPLPFIWHTLSATVPSRLISAPRPGFRLLRLVVDRQWFRDRCAAVDVRRLREEAKRSTLREFPLHAVRRGTRLSD